MKQEDKELLLKDLCARLSYSVQIRIESYNIGVLKGIDGDIISTDKGINYPLKFVRPYLFPLSSMTERQREELVSKNLGYYQVFDGIGRRFFFEKGFEIYDWFNKNHFDYRGLIKKGLAIDATNKNVYK